MSNNKVPLQMVCQEFKSLSASVAPYQVSRGPALTFLAEPRTLCFAFKLERCLVFIEITAQ